MKNKSVYLVVLIILLSAVGVTSYPCENSIEKTVHGFDCCWDIIIPDDYPSIQMGIDHADPGDRIFVRIGIYKENINIDIEQLVLCGEKQETTIIDGDGNDYVVKITANGTLFNNFTVCNGSLGNVHAACIEIFSYGNIITNNSCYTTNYGIWVMDSKDNTIVNNTCICRWDGIWLDNSGQNILRDNSMIGSGLVIDGFSLSAFIQDIDTSNTVNGKPVYYYKNQTGVSVPLDAGQVILVNCNNCIVADLNICNVTDGIEILYSDNNIIRNNTLFGNTDMGIRLFKSNYNLLTNNNCSNTPIGISFTSSGYPEAFERNADCKYNDIISNTFSSNYNGILIVKSNYNKISMNNFIENSDHARFICSHGNKWCSNYWDDWIGLKYKIFRVFPKRIHGSIYQLNFMKLSIPWRNMDWNPQPEPYDF